MPINYFSGSISCSDSEEKNIALEADISPSDKVSQKNIYYPKIEIRCFVQVLMKPLDIRSDNQVWRLLLV